MEESNHYDDAIKKFEKYVPVNGNVLIMVDDGDNQKTAKNSSVILTNNYREDRITGKVIAQADDIQSSGSAGEEFVNKIDMNFDTAILETYGDREGFLQSHQLDVHNVTSKIIGANSYCVRLICVHYSTIRVLLNSQK